jgi:hypothetical protein
MAHCRSPSTGASGRASSRASQAYKWFKREHLEAPTSDRLTRIIRSGLHTFEQQLYDPTLDRLPEASQVALEALLQTEVAALEMSEDQGQGPPDPQATRIQTTGTLQVISQDPGRSQSSQ